MDRGRPDRYSAMPVIPFQQRLINLGVPLICFLDLQIEYISQGRALALEEQIPWMENCRRLLSLARAKRMSIGHFRQLWKTPFLNPATEFSSWIDEFRPRPSEMTFERDSPSCYAAHEFVSVLNNIENPHILVAGLTGHGACLATVLDGYHRKHHITFVNDASWTPALGSLTAAASHTCVTDIIACYAEVVPTNRTLEWLSGAAGRLNMEGSS